MAPTANLDQKDKQFVAKVSAWRSRAGTGAGYLHVVGKTPKLGFNSPPWTTWVPPRLGLPSVGQSQGLMASVQPMVPAPCLGSGEVEQGRGSGAAGWGQAAGHPWVPQGPPGCRGQGSAELPLPITVAPCPFPLSLVWELHPKAVLTPSPVRFGCFWQQSRAVRAPCLPRACIPRGEHHIGGAAAGNPELRGC